jgi:hypothetical protein
MSHLIFCLLQPSQAVNLRGACGLWSFPGPACSSDCEAARMPTDSMDWSIASPGVEPMLLVSLRRSSSCGTENVDDACSGIARSPEYSQGLFRFAIVCRVRVRSENWQSQHTVMASHHRGTERNSSEHCNTCLAQISGASRKPAAHQGLTSGSLDIRDRSCVGRCALHKGPYDSVS